MQHSLNSITASCLGVEFDLSVSTPTNAMYARAKGGQVRISDPYRAWKLQAGKEILAQRPKMAVRSLPPGLPYGILIRVAVTDPADIDGRLKTLIDLLHQMRMTPDDKLLFDQRIYRASKAVPGLMRVRIWTLDEVPA